MFTNLVFVFLFFFRFPFYYNTHTIMISTENGYGDEENFDSFSIFFPPVFPLGFKCCRAAVYIWG